jgi:hypothetical protein
VLYKQDFVIRLGRFIDLISIIGLSTFILGSSLLVKTSKFPGWWALLPTLGGAFLILAGPNALVNRRILSNKILIWFGLISYPLYLWHWPLLAYSRIMESGLPSYAVRTISVFLSVVLAWLTYILLEQNIRNGKGNKAKIASLIALLIIIGCLGYKTYSTGGFSSRPVIRLMNLKFGSDFSDGMENMLNDCGIQDERAKDLFAVCAKDKRGNVKYALIGDSKAQALYPGLISPSGKQGRWLFIGGNGKNGAPVPLLPSDNLAPKFPLTAIAVDSVVANKEIKTVVLVTAIRAIFSLNDTSFNSANIKSYNHKYLSELVNSPNYELAFDGLSATISRLEKANKKVILVVDNPALPNPQDCLPRVSSFNLINKFLGNKKNKDCSISLNEFESEILLYKKLLSELKEKFPNVVEIYDPTFIYCNQNLGVCESTRSGKILYGYTDHISGYAAGLVGMGLNNFLNKK